MDTQPPPVEDVVIADAIADPLRLKRWLWQPWYAKLWWATVPIYWGGRMASIKVTALASLYDTLVAGYLAVFCNPLVILLLLGFGFVRAKLDRGEWIITPDRSVKTHRGDAILDPYTDPTDPRSGVLYLRYIGAYDD